MKNIALLMSTCAILCVDCTMPVEKQTVIFDFEQQVTLETAEEHLRIDSLFCITPNKDAFVARFDKMIPSGENIYVMDGMQQAVFKIDMRTKSVSRFIDNMGAAKSEYMAITDMDMDEEGNILLYDSDSRKVNVYDASGHYVRTVNVVCGTSLAVSENGNIGINTGQLEEDQIVVYSPDGKSLTQVKSDLTYPNFSFDNIRGIARWKDSYIFTEPFDYHVYGLNGSSIYPIAELDPGDKRCDVEKLKNMDVAACRDAVIKTTDKIMFFNNLNVANDKIFLSTDMNDQILYDVDENNSIVLSNIEPPYNILFSTPVFTGKDGLFCTMTTNSNIVNGYMPSADARGVKNPKLKVQQKDISDDGSSFWILVGKIK